MTQTIGLVAAMPEEIKPLLKKVGRYSKDCCSGFTLYRFSLENRQICLIESGMGARRADAATRALIAACSPDVIVNFGFAGAVTGSITVGDIVIASRVIEYGNGTVDLSETPVGISGRTLVQTQTPGVHGDGRTIPATFITAQRILDKRDLAARLPVETGEYVLDMETAAVVKAAQDAGLPTLAIRAISDGAGEELGFSIEEFTDDTMTIRPWRVMKTIARKPWIIPQLIRLAGNVNRAGSNLADAMIAELVNMPEGK